MRLRPLSHVLILSTGIVVTVGCSSGGSSDSDGGDGPLPTDGNSKADMGADVPPVVDTGTPPTDTGADTGVDTGPVADGGPKDAGGEAKAESGSDASPTESGTDAVADSGTDTSTGSDSGTVPTTCAQTDTTFGCCAGSVLYYCATGATKVTKKACTGTTSACGWDATKTYYNCVAPQVPPTQAAPTPSRASRTASHDGTFRFVTTPYRPSGCRSSD